MTIFKALLQSHEVQKLLCAKIVQTKGDTNKRRQLHQQLMLELRAHAQAEERYFYMPLMHHDEGLEITRHVMFEHHQLEDKLNDIEQLDYSHSQWLVKMKQVVDMLLLHLEEEEQIFFPKAQSILSEAQKNDLAAQYWQEYHKIHDAL